MCRRTSIRHIQKWHKAASRNGARRGTARETTERSDLTESTFFSRLTKQRETLQRTLSDHSSSEIFKRTEYPLFIKITEVKKMMSRNAIPAPGAISVDACLRLQGRPIVKLTPAPKAVVNLNLNVNYF